MTEVKLTPEAQAELAKLAIDLANNPETRKDFARMTKKIDPKRRFPDVEAEDLREEMKREFEERDRKREADRVKAELESQKEALKGQYDEESISRIEKIMEENGLSNYELGARLFAAETKPAIPTPAVSDHRWKLPEVDPKDFDKLSQNTLATAYTVIDELKRKRA